MNAQQDSERWRRELLAAGWKPHKGMATTWEAPNGALFIGPYGAWKRMVRERERNEHAES